MVTPGFRLATSGSSLLLVEGNDDLRFFRAFLNHLGRPDIHVHQVGGKSNFAPFLAALPNLPNFDQLQHLGIARDTDTSPQSTFQSLRDALAHANLPAPHRAYEPINADGLTVSVATIPDDQTKGELEDLCLRSIEGNPELRCVDEYLDCIQDNGPTHPELSKAKLYAYLASGTDPRRRIGRSGRCWSLGLGITGISKSSGVPAHHVVAWTQAKKQATVPARRWPLVCTAETSTARPLSSRRSARQS